jgi:hypothetical protein
MKNEFANHQVDFVFIMMAAAQSVLCIVKRTFHEEIYLSTMQNKNKIEGRRGEASGTEVGKKEKIG